MIEAKYLAVALIGAHFLSDWVLQTRYIAENKSKSWLVLGHHLGIIAGGICVAFILCGVPATPVILGKFALYILAHGIQDRYIWRFYEKHYHDPKRPDYKPKAFYNTIAVDQFIHLSLLMLFFL